ncbi:hypothetical protein SAMN04487770_11978 [Butyrivibrio sp. ob235]|uniref:hypothetical protein n=1 Tax=unclassified Butyrivibrio TaxID=2639466 RepID=UPI0003B6E680|nr:MULTISPECIES: hypothetical protein [unclassified Butyrivibrio]SEL87116.1 hypothetical protein SAMN04487770_11978 [Butyrivibrio sp. ob235]
MKKAFHVAYGACIAAACMLFSGVSVKAVGGVAIDSGNFPDDGFRKIVSEKCDKDKDGELSALEISETKSLIVGDNHDDGFADIQAYH